jgi:uncharacterized protein
MWAPFALPIYTWVKDPNLVNLLTLPVLYIEFIILIRLWGQHIYRQPNLLQRYGLEITPQMGWLVLAGLIPGTALVFIIFGLQAGLGWLDLSIVPQSRLLQVIAEGLLMSFLLGVAEELVFRGWLLDELERDYSPRVALWVSSLIFALVHFIKPWEVIQRMWFALPALLFLGVALVWAKRSTRSVKKAQRHLLGLPIGLHTGLVWGYYVISVGQLVSYNNTVPEWITGIDRNPLSGVLGCVSMGAIALMLRRSATRNSLQSRSH